MALDKSVLVLNKFFQAVQITSVRRAFSLFCKGYVRAVDEEYATYTLSDWQELPPGEDFVRTPRLQLRVPRVIQLIHYDKVPKFKIRFSRKNIFLRDRYVCQYCGIKYDERDLTLDHVVPTSKGGGNSWQNLVTCCFDCNNQKGNRKPDEAGMRLLRQPKRPHWIPFSRFTKHRNTHPLWKTFIDFAYYGFPVEDE
jgi:5-methylcytosine-specific restriction endonuclease McrA